MSLTLFGEVLDPTVQSEITKLNNNLSKGVAAVSDLMQIGNNTLSASNQLLQSVSDWSLPGQFESVTQTITDAFTFHDENLFTNFEATFGILTETFDVQNEILTTSFEEISGFLTESFAVRDEFLASALETVSAIMTECCVLETTEIATGIAMLMEHMNVISSLEMAELTANLTMLAMALNAGFALEIAMISMSFAALTALLSAFAIAEIALLTAAFAVTMALWQGYFTAELAMLSVAFSALTALLTTCFTIEIAAIATGFLALATLLSAGFATLSAISLAATALQTILLTGILFQVSDDTDDKEGLQLARNANKLAAIGNTIAGIDLIVTGMTAFDPFSKIAAIALGATGVAAAAASWAFAFKDGGFPITGQLFRAREAGPELVGTFPGNRTAVANNVQILQGITAGVQNANFEQNNLLREQNALLRELIRNSGNPAPVKVMLDGKELYINHQRQAAAHGVTLGLNPAFAR